MRKNEIWLSSYPKECEKDKYLLGISFKKGLCSNPFLNSLTVEFKKDHGRFFLSQNCMLKSEGLLRHMKANGGKISSHLLPCHCAICQGRGHRETCTAQLKSLVSWSLHLLCLPLGAHEYAQSLPSPKNTVTAELWELVSHQRVNILWSTKCCSVVTLVINTGLWTS